MFKSNDRAVDEQRMRDRQRRRHFKKSSCRRSTTLHHALRWQKNKACLITLTFSHLINRKNLAINRDQVKGALKEVEGKIQAKTGEIIGGTNQQVKGLLKEAEDKT